MLGSEFPRVLRSARAGEAQAWEAIYRNLAPVVLGYLRGRGSRDPEDLTGDVFVAVVKSLDRFHGDERAFRTWVLTIAHRRLVDELRRGNRAVEEVAGLDVPTVAIPIGDVEAEALDRLGTTRVRELLNSLSQDQQDVLLLRILGDQTIEEVAKILNKRPGAVKALQRRGLAALRRRFGSARIPPAPSNDYLSDEAF
jgi:RNA polymerase sigma factor (sigma-70 family)